MPYFPTQANHVHQLTDDTTQYQAKDFCSAGSSSKTFSKSQNLGLGRVRIRAKTRLTNSKKNPPSQDFGSDGDDFIAPIRPPRPPRRSKKLKCTETDVYKALSAYARRERLSVKSGYLCHFNLEVPPEWARLKYPPCTPYCFLNGRLPCIECSQCYLLFHSQCAHKQIQLLRKCDRLRAGDEIRLRKSCPNCMDSFAPPLNLDPSSETHSFVNKLKSYRVKEIIKNENSETLCRSDAPSILSVSNDPPKSVASSQKTIEPSISHSLIGAKRNCSQVSSRSPVIDVQMPLLKSYAVNLTTNPSISSHLVADVASSAFVTCTASPDIAGDIDRRPALLTSSSRPNCIPSNQSANSLPPLSLSRFTRLHFQSHASNDNRSHSYRPTLVSTSISSSLLRHCPLSSNASTQVFQGRFLRNRNRSLDLLGHCFTAQRSRELKRPSPLCLQTQLGIFDDIFSRLDTVSRLRCRLVCRGWRRILDSSPPLCGGRLFARSGYSLRLTSALTLWAWIRLRRVTSLDMRSVELDDDFIEQLATFAETDAAVAWLGPVPIEEMRLSQCSPKVAVRLRGFLPHLRILTVERETISNL